MANPERGEVDVTANGETFTLKLSTNAVATVSKRHSKTFGQLLRDVDDLDVVSIRGITWAMLQKNHAAKFKNEEAVGDFIDDVGGIRAMNDKIGEVLQLNSAPPDPQQAQGTNGTGTDSTSTPDASA